MMDGFQTTAQRSKNIDFSPHNTIRCTHINRCGRVSNLTEKPGSILIEITVGICKENQDYNNYHHHHLILNQALSLLTWPNFVWLLSLPRIAISFDHMHPLSPAHFSSFHSLLIVSKFVSIFLYYRALHISKPSLSHFHLFFSKHDCTTTYYLL